MVPWNQGMVPYPDMRVWVWVLRYSFVEVIKWRGLEETFNSEVSHRNINIYTCPQSPEPQIDSHLPTNISVLNTEYMASILVQSTCCLYQSENRGKWWKLIICIHRWIKNLAIGVSIAINMVEASYLENWRHSFYMMLQLTIHKKCLDLFCR